MKTIFFIRHAKSSWDDPALDDLERPLNKRGKRDAPYMAKVLKTKNIRPDKLLSSPAVRAYSTAVVFAETFGIPVSDIAVEETIYEGYPEHILELIRNLPQEWSTVLLFGHNPCYTSIANRFSKTVIDNIPTCGIFGLQADIEHWSDFDESSAQWIDLYYPKQFKG